MTGVQVRLEGIRAEAGGTRILDVPALELPGGETTAVLGPNGAGKSTLVRIASGLRPAETGRVLIDGQAAAPSERRALAAAVLQRPLLGRGSVRRNVELGLRFARVDRVEARSRGQRWLDLLGIAQLADRPARGLSGGEAQRVSLARALALEPRMLVLDEPFAALDLSTRAGLLGELRALLAAAATTAVLVTHDPGEAAALASHVVVLQAGVVRQAGPTAGVFARPADRETARLLGYDNVIGPAEAEQLGLSTATPVAFRAADLSISAGDGAGEARVVRSIPVAGASQVVVALGGTTVVGTSASLGGFPEGSPARVRLAAERCVPVGGADRHAGGTRRRSDAGSPRA